MNNTFKKEDLKAGMLIQYRNGDYRLVVPNRNNDELIFTGNGGWSDLLSYNDELKNIISSDCDIMKIYSQNIYLSDYMQLDTKNRQLLWERKEEDEYMTFWEAKKYNFIKHKDIGECRCLIGKTDDVISVGVVLLKDLDKKVWIGANKFIK